MPEPDIEQIRQQISSARAVVEQKKQEVREIESQLEQEKSAIPDYTSQRILRGQRFGEGMQGRVFRQKAELAKKEIESKQQDIQDYKTQLGEYESQVASSEEQLREYDEQVEGLELAQDAILEDNPFIATLSDNRYAKKYYKRMLNDINAEKELRSKINAALEKYNSGVPFDVAFKNINVDFLTRKGYLKFTDEFGNPISISQEAIINAKNAYNQNLSSPRSIMDILKMSSQMPRTDAVQVRTPIITSSILKTEMLPLVSAKSLNLNSPSDSNVNGNESSRILGTINRDSVLDLDKLRNNKIYSGQEKIIGGTEPTAEASKSIVEAAEPAPKESILKGVWETTGGFIGSTILGAAKLGARAGVYIATHGQFGDKINQYYKDFYEGTEKGRKAFGREEYKYAYQDPDIQNAAVFTTGTLMGGLGGSFIAGNLYQQSLALQTSEAISEPSKTNWGRVTGMAALPFVAAKAPEVGLRTYDIIRTAGMEKIEMPPINAKGFMRNGEMVYMRRATGFQLAKPKSWIESLQGYKPGQFVKRQYRLIAPEVQSRYEGGPGTSFPYDKPETHLEWFTKKNMQEYYLPKKSELPFNAKKMAYGLSATGKEWNTNVIGDAGSYYSGKGISIRFLRIANKRSPQQAGVFDSLFGKKPIVYAGYAKKAVVNPGYEIKVPNPYEPNGKPIKKYIFSKPTEKGVFNIPVHKLEVESVAYGEKVPVRRKFYFELGGRRVPIEEHVFRESLSPKELTILNTKQNIKTKTTNSMESVLPDIPSKKSYVFLPEISKKSSLNVLNTKSSILASPVSTKQSITSLGKIDVFSNFKMPRSPHLKTSEPNPIISKLKSFLSDIKLKYQKVSYPSLSKTPNRIITEPTTILPPRKVVYSQKGGKVVKVAENRYVVFVKRFGQDSIIAETSTLDEAKKILESNLTQTLAASGFIAEKTTNQKIDISDMFGSMFVPSKKDKYRLVQRLGKRLSSPSEIWGMQASKKNKSENSNWFSGFSKSKFEWW